MVNERPTKSTQNTMHLMEVRVWMDRQANLDRKETWPLLRR